MAPSHDQLHRDINQQTRDGRRDQFVGVAASFLKGLATFEELKHASKVVRQSKDYALCSLADHLLWLVDLNRYDGNFKPDRDCWDELLRIIAFLRSDLLLKRPESRSPVSEDLPDWMLLLIVVAVSGVVLLGAKAGGWLAMITWFGAGIAGLIYFKRRSWSIVHKQIDQVEQRALADQAHADGETLHHPFADSHEMSIHLVRLEDLSLPQFHQSLPSDQEVQSTILLRRRASRIFWIVLYALMVAMGFITLVAVFALNRNRLNQFDVCESEA